MTSLPIEFRDGTSSALNWFPAAAAKQTILVLPAMGVRASFYRPLALSWQEAGFHVVTADWRGLGQSSIQATRAVDYGYEELVLDIQEMTTLVKERFPETELVLAGHSLGGQLGTVCESRFPGTFDRIMLIASCMVYHGGFHGWRAMQVRMASRIFPWIARLVGYFPGDQVGFGGRAARTMLADWGHNGLYGTYEFRSSNFDYEAALPKVNVPILAISFGDDYLAPKTAVAQLYGKVPQCPVEHIDVTELTHGLTKLDHFSWVRQPELVTGLVVQFL